MDLPGRLSCDRLVPLRSDFRCAFRASVPKRGIPATPAASELFDVSMGADTASQLGFEYA